VTGRPVDYEAELQLHDEVLRRACGVQPDEQVLDTGDLAYAPVRRSTHEGAGHLPTLFMIGHPSGD